MNTELIEKLEAVKLIFKDDPDYADCVDAINEAIQALTPSLTAESAEEVLEQTINNSQEGDRWITKPYKRKHVKYYRKDIVLQAMHTYAQKSNLPAILYQLKRKIDEATDTSEEYRLGMAEMFNTLRVMLASEVPVESGVITKEQFINVADWLDKLTPRDRVSVWSKNGESKGLFTMDNEQLYEKYKQLLERKGQMLINIENSTKQELLDEYHKCEKDWDKYSSDCFGFYIEALRKKIVELGGFNREEASDGL